MRNKRRTGSPVSYESDSRAITTVVQDSLWRLVGSQVDLIAAAVCLPSGTGCGSIGYFGRAGATWLQSL